MARKRIRERVKRGVLDFRYLADPECLPTDDLQKIREFREDGETVTESFWKSGDVAEEPILDPELEEGITELVGFAYRVSPATIEETVATGVQRAINRDDSDATVGDVEIPIEDPETIARRAEDHIEAGVPLTETELRVALEREVRPPDEVAAHLQEHGTREAGTPDLQGGFFGPIDGVQERLDEGDRDGE